MCVRHKSGYCKFDVGAGPCACPGQGNRRGLPLQDVFDNPCFMSHISSNFLGNVFGQVMILPIPIQEPTILIFYLMIKITWKYLL